MSEVRNIPKHWQIKRLGEILKVSSGKGLKINLLQGGNYPVYGGNGINGFHSEYFIESPKLIIGRVGAKCGVTCITKPKSWVTDNALIVDPVISDFDLKFFQLKLEYENLNKLSVSTAQPVISGSKIYEYEILLPPLSEQQLIVSKIEELLSDLDNGKQQLLIAQQQLKVYRQSLLKWAFEGKLTNKNIKNGELPKEWKWVNSGDLFAFVTSGSRGWAKYYSQSGSIFIRITNMDFDTLKLDLKESKIQYVNPPSNSEGIRTKVQEGDFLFSITGYLGMFAIAPKLESAYVNQHVCLCRPKVGFNKKYVGYWIISKSGGHHHLNKNQKGAVKAGLNLDDLKSFPVPLASLEEQQLIVDQLESKLTVCDKIEETISQSLLQAETLRQSILKKAFEGKLVCLNYDSDDKLDKHEMGLAAEKQVPYKTSS